MIKRENPDIEGDPGDWGDVGDRVVLAQVPVEPQHLARARARVGDKRRRQEQEKREGDKSRRQEQEQEKVARTK